MSRTGARETTVITTATGMGTGMAHPDGGKADRRTEWVQLGLIFVLVAAILAWSLLNRLA